MTDLSETPDLSIGDLEKLTGIRSATLRMWERRYGSPKSFRLPSGHRRYPRDEVPRLRAIAEALECGYRAGKVVSASLEELGHLLAQPRTGSPTPAEPPEIFPRTILLGQWIQAVHHFDDGALTQGFHDEWGRLGPLRFVQGCAAPFLHAVGKGWETGELTVAQEHFASERLGDFLGGQWRRLNERKSGPSAVLTTLPGESHRLGVQMCAAVTALSDFKVIYLGPDTPLEDIARAVSKVRARLLALSVSTSTDPVLAQREIMWIRKRLPLEVELVLGGGGAPANLPDTRRIEDFIDYLDWLNGLLSRHP